MVFNGINKVIIVLTLIILSSFCVTLIGAIIWEEHFDKLDNRKPKIVLSLKNVV